MLRIRRVFDDVLPVNRAALRQVREILGEQIDDLPQHEIESLATKLRNPLAYRFRPVLFVAEDERRNVLGFALVLHDPTLAFAYLDYMAAARGLTRRGIGGSLYERVRDETAALGCRGVLFECLPDEDLPEGTPEEKRRENKARLRFYETFGARPLVDNDYRTPLSPENDYPMPFLVLDPLGRPAPVEGAWLRKVVRAILERKYSHLYPPEYVERVARSFRGKEARLREFRYVAPRAETPRRRRVEPVPLVVNDRHEIHHVKDRGYVESPVRIRRILEVLEPTGWFERVAPRQRGVRHIEAVHDPELVRYLRRASREVGEGESLYPYVFPIRNEARKPRERSVLAGYYCIDTFTPIHRNSYPAAKRAVDCTLVAADQIRAGARLAYSLVRPPGHHAERRCFGGFCYFNNAAVAAHYLAAHAKVAILDVDYHHGNGQQDVFYSRGDVLTVSIHGHPRFAYPYFSGFEEETGEGEGEGANLNLPLQQRIEGREYRRALRRALDRVTGSAPDVLVLAFGLDPAKADPTGTWSLGAADFEANGNLLRELDLPILVVQEGGYRTRTLGTNARAFFRGLVGA